MTDTAHPLFALSPLDGRYRSQGDGLRPFLSEFGLLRFRVVTEVEWLLALAAEPAFTPLPPFSAADQVYLRGVAEHFSAADAEEIKATERTTNHDVKAVEYFLKARLRARASLAPYEEFVHFACTSEDINNVSHALMLKHARDEALLPAMDAMLTKLKSLADSLAAMPMLSRTHGQLASPTTMGKELANFLARLRNQRDAFAVLPLPAKLNGAVGNFNAHLVAAPEVAWPVLSTRVLEGLGLTMNPYTTQIEPHDGIAAYCHSLQRFGQVLLDMNRDLWGYISLGYFTQRAVATETGSSTMPHKVNPIDFENSEGNLGLAHAVLSHLADKLPVSRWQRDLSDSTVLRNLGVGLGHLMIALTATLRGLGKIEADPQRMAQDLDHSWEVLAEPIQTILRQEGVDQPYERLKEATRGRHLDAEAVAELLEALPLSAEGRARLQALTPATYLGLAETLARAL